MKLYLSLIYMILFCVNQVSGASFTKTEFYFNKVQTCSKEFFNDLSVSLAYKLDEVSYLKLFPYKTAVIPDNAIPVDMIITECNGNKKFKVKISVDKSEKFFIDYDVNNMVNEIVEFLKSKYPLTGEIIKKNRDNVILNIGINYNVKREDEFIIVHKRKVIAHLLVLKVFSTYSRAKITFSKGSVSVGDKVIKVTYKLINNLILNAKCNIKNLNKKFLARDKTENFKVVNYKNNIFISKYYECGIYGLLNNRYIKISEIGYNRINDVVFSLNDSFVGYVDNLNHLTIVDLINYTKFYVRFNTYDNKYYLLSESEIKYRKLKVVKVGAFCFHKNKIIFFDSDKRNLVEFDLLNYSYSEYELKNIAYIKRIDKVFITGNKERLIIAYVSTSGVKSLLVKDLISGNETIVENIKFYLYDYVEKDILYIKKTSVYRYKMYLDNTEKLFTFTDVFDNIKLSFSERFLLFYSSANPNQLNMYDFKTGKIKKDIFKSGKIKYIKKVYWLKDGDVLLFGRLNDDDKNNKIDYRDSYGLMKLSVNTFKISKIGVRVDELYTYSSYDNFILYKFRDVLYLLRCPYEK